MSKPHNIPQVDKSKIYKFYKFNMDNHRGVVMVDLFDKDYNRHYFHIQPSGECIFEVMSPRQHTKFHTDIPSKSVKSLSDIQRILKDEGIQIVFVHED